MENSSAAFGDILEMENFGCVVIRGQPTSVMCVGDKFKGCVSSNAKGKTVISCTFEDRIVFSQFRQIQDSRWYCERGESEQRLFHTPQGLFEEVLLLGGGLFFG